MGYYSTEYCYSTVPRAHRSYPVIFFLSFLDFPSIWRLSQFKESCFAIHLRVPVWVEVHQKRVLVLQMNKLWSQKLVHGQNADRVWRGGWGVAPDLHSRSFFYENPASYTQFWQILLPWSSLIPNPAPFLVKSWITNPALRLTFRDLFESFVWIQTEFF